MKILTKWVVFLCRCLQNLIMGKGQVSTGRIFINALPFSLEDEDLEDAIYNVLSSYGTVKSVRLVFEGTNLRPKGLCFAEMSSPEEAEDVIDAMDGLTVVGYDLEVRHAVPRLVHSVPTRSTSSTIVNSL